jgi:hypothetical protein
MCRFALFLSVLKQRPTTAAQKGGIALALFLSGASADYI